MKLKWWHVAGIIGGIATYKAVKAFHYDAYRPMILFAAENYQYPLRIAEIGVLWGTNARRMFDRLNVEEMYLIDPYEKYSEYNWQEVVFLPSSFNSAMTRLEQHWDKCIPLQMTSEEAASIIPNDLDMVYIDGNHAYEFVKKDIELYAPKIKPGGIIGGHDIEGSPMTAGVQQAVFEYADEHYLHVYVDKPDWWIIL